MCPLYLNTFGSKIIRHNYLSCVFSVGPNEKISVFRVTGLKILGRVGTHICFYYFFPGKNIILCILKGKMPFKMLKKIPENLKKS